MPRACVSCQRRKIGCDRRTPCSACVKADVECTPSVPVPYKRRKKATDTSARGSQGLENGEFSRPEIRSTAEASVSVGARLSSQTHVSIQCLVNH